MPEVVVRSRLEVGNELPRLVDDQLPAPKRRRQPELLRVKLGLQPIERIAVRPAKAVDRLAVVAHRDDAPLRHALRDQQLTGVHVLRLVDDDEVIEGPEPFVAHRQEQHVGEIDADRRAMRRRHVHRLEGPPLDVGRVVAEFFPDLPRLAFELEEKIGEVARLRGERHDLAPERV